MDFKLFSKICFLIHVFLFYNGTAELMSCKTGTFQTKKFITNVSLSEADYTENGCSYDTGEEVTGSRRWPGPVSNLSATRLQLDRTFILQWGSPTDASAEALTGFLLTFYVETYDVLSLGPAVCYAMTLNQWFPKQKGPLLQDAVFETQCEVYYPGPLDVCVYVIPQPVPLLARQQNYASVIISYEGTDHGIDLPNSLPSLDSTFKTQKERSDSHDIYDTASLETKKSDDERQTVDSETVYIVISAVMLLVLVLTVVLWVVMRRRRADCRRQRTPQQDLDIPLNNLNPERVDDCIPGDENHQQDIQGCDVQETSCHLLTESVNTPPNKAFKEHSSDLYVECEKSENLCAGFELDGDNSEFVERDPVWIRLKPTDIDGPEGKSSGSEIRDLSLDSTYIPFPKYFRDFTEVVNKI